MRRSGRKLVLVILTLLAFSAMVLTGCGPKGPDWVEQGGSYTTATLSTLYAKADTSKLASQSVDNAPKLRHDALAALRQRGVAAAAAADLITRTLASDSGSVPVYVVKASVAGQPAIVIVEASGPAHGKLIGKRLWAISEKGAVLFFGTR